MRDHLFCRVTTATDELLALELMRWWRAEIIVYDKHFKKVAYFTYALDRENLARKVFEGCLPFECEPAATFEIGKYTYYDVAWWIVFNALQRFGEFMLVVPLE